MLVFSGPARDLQGRGNGADKKKGRKFAVILFSPVPDLDRQQNCTNIDWLEGTQTDYLVHFSFYKKELLHLSYSQTMLFLLAEPIL